MIDLRMEDQDAVSRCEFCGNQHGDERCGCDAAKDAEITTFRAQLDEARAKAIEECLECCGRYAATLSKALERKKEPSEYDTDVFGSAISASHEIEISLRALIAGSTK